MRELQISENAVPQMEPLANGAYKITFRGVNGEPDVVLISEGVLAALTLMTLNRLPSLQPNMVVPSENDVYRLPLKRLLGLDDRSIQVLLRNLEADTIIDAVWLADDPEFKHRVVTNLSRVAGAMLINDVHERYKTLTPNTAPVARVQAGRRAALTMINVAQSLARQGEILDINAIELKS